MRPQVELKTPFTVSLSPRQATYAMRESRRLQITVAELLRRMVDRELDYDERQNPINRLHYKT